jgi:hypothetical protein
MVIEFLDLIGIYFINFGIVICSKLIDEALPLNISCGMCHPVPPLEHFPAFSLLPESILSSESLKKALFIALRFFLVLGPLLIELQLPGETVLFINEVIGQLFLLHVQIPQLLSLVHHLESDGVDQMVGGLVDFHHFLLIDAMILDIFLHHLHDFDPLFLLSLFLKQFVLFVLGHGPGDILPVLFDVFLLFHLDLLSH